MKTSLLKFLSVIALCSSGALLTAATPAVDKLLAQAESQIETGGQTNDLGPVQAANLTIDKVLLVQPKNPLAWYFKGYAAYTESTLQASKGNTAGRAAALEEADRALKKAIALDRSGEALAVHAIVLSVLIGVRGPESAAALSGQSIQELAEARRLSPKSPRVAIQAGILAFYTPPQWGGDVHDARKLFQQAVTDFDESTDATSLPSWGKAEAHVWLGQTFQKLDDKEKARAEYQAALSIAPDYAWVRYALLPELDKPTS